ncbi:MAG: A24 family peptidase [Planctomycetota bacterium]
MAVTLSIESLIALIVLMLIASITDVRRQMIYNANTYPGIVVGFVFRWWDGGQPGLEDAVKGFAVCGGLMLVCFVLFGLGGGDLKLVAMMGAFLGFERGVEALLWTLVLGGILGGAVIVWQMGFVNIVVGVGRHLARLWRFKGWVPLSTEARQPLQQTLFLAPAGLLATLIVTWDRWSNFAVLHQ